MGDLLTDYPSHFSQVLLYDLRSSKPLLVKDHMYGLPIKRVLFTEGSEEEGRVLSMDSQVVGVFLSSSFGTCLRQRL